MQSPDHIGIVDLISRDLAIIPELIARARGREPPSGLRLEQRDGRLIAYSFIGPPREIQVDILLLGYPADVPDGSPQIITPFEAQLSKDPEKLYRCVEYIAAARRDYRCPGQTAVFSPDPEVLAYIERLFADEPHYCPILVGKDAVPRVLTHEHAIARPELATLSAIVHQHDDVDRQLARHAIASARFVEPQRGRANVRALLNCLKEAAMTELRATPEYRDTIDEWARDDFQPGPWLQSLPIYQRFREGLEEGKREGRLEGLEEGIERGLQQGIERGLHQGLNLLLAARGLTPNEAEQATIARASHATLERWMSRAAEVGSVAELLAEP